MATPSPRERRMGERITSALADDPNAPLLTDEEIRRHQENNLRQWQEAYAGASSPKQREILLAELEDRRGIDFPGHAQAATGFQFPVLEKNQPAIQGFEFPAIPRPADPRIMGPSEAIPKIKRAFEEEFPAVGRTFAEMGAREALPGSGVNRTPVIGFETTPGGAATGIQTPRVAGDDIQPGGPGARVAAETTGAFAGGFLGALPGRAMRSPRLAEAGMRAGEAGGAFLGSLFSEAFDPTENPLETASIAAGFTGATGIAASGSTAVLRRAIGKPTEAGKRILDIMEKEGKVPPPGAVLPEYSIAQSIQSIGSAEAFFGRNVKELVQETGLAITKDLRHYVADFYRFKRGADKVFAEWDDIVKSLLDNPNFAKQGTRGIRRVEISIDHFDALEKAVSEWDRLGLRGQLRKDAPQLLDIVERVQAAKTAGWALKDKVPITMAEAEAARTFIYNQARKIAGSTSTESGAIAGKDFAKAYREIADDIGKSMDEAIDDAIRNNRIPVDARAKLEGGRALWKQWKQGEAILDELAIPLKSARRAGEPLNASRIETAINSIETVESRLGRPVVSSTQKAHLSGIMRALKASEESGKSSAFTLAVRTGQLASLTVHMGLQGIAMALSPAAFTFMVTNPKAASLLIRGLRLEPGTAGAARVGRELLSLLAKEGHADIQREPTEEE